MATNVRAGMGQASRRDLRAPEDARRHSEELRAHQASSRDPAWDAVDPKMQQVLCQMEFDGGTASDDQNHLITPEERLQVAMAKQ